MSDESTTATALAVQIHAPLMRTNTLNPDVVTMIQALAPSFHACRWYGLASPEQAIVIMTKAVELGIPATAAFEFFDIIENKPSLKPIGALALIHRSPLVDVIGINSQADRCTVTMQRRDSGFRHTASFSLDDARQAGLIKPDKDGSAWKRYPADMLRNRAIARCARVVAPDVLAGLYLTDELRTEALDVSTGEIMEVRL